MTSLWQLKRFEARMSLFKSLDCPLALAAAGMNQRFTRYPPVINHNLGWCNFLRPAFQCVFLSFNMVQVAGLATYYNIQIKICAEYRDMLPRPRLVCQEPGLRPIGRSPGVPDKSSRRPWNHDRYCSAAAPIIMSLQYHIATQIIEPHAWVTWRSKSMTWKPYLFGDYHFLDIITSSMQRLTITGINRVWLFQCFISLPERMEMCDCACICD